MHVFPFVGIVWCLISSLIQSLKEYFTKDRFFFNSRKKIFLKINLKKYIFKKIIPGYMI